MNGFRKFPNFWVKFFLFRSTLCSELKISMDINIIKFFFSLPICMVGIMHLLLPDQLNGFETKRFDAPPPKRTTYLKFAPPKALRYASGQIKANRGNLLIVSNSTTDQKQPALTDVNATQSTPSFPLVAFPDDEKPFVDEPQPTDFNIPSTIQMKAPKDELPLADPFESSSMDSVNSTDELLRVLEKRQVGVTSGNILMPFIPPYTSAPENIVIESKASYKRIQR